MPKSNKSWVRFTFFIIAAILLWGNISSSVSAQVGGSTGPVTGGQSGPATGGSPGQVTGGTPPSASGCENGGSGLCNPLKSESITEFLMNVIEIILVFAKPIIVLFIMYGGYLLVTAQGEPTKLEKGRNAILWAVVGGVIILGANLILSVIKTTVESI